MADISAHPELRDLHTRGLDTSLLNPNVVRMEVLDGNKVQRYLGTIERIGYDTVRAPLMDNIFDSKDPNKADKRIFYGILKNGIENTWGMTAEWAKPSGGGGLLGMIRGLTKDIPVVGPGLDVVEGVLKLGERITGTNTSATGSSTMKQYMGADLKSPKITVGWYLPEQYGICIKGLQTLVQMTYARSLDTTKFVEDISNIGQRLINEGISKVVNFPNKVPGVSGLATPVSADDKPVTPNGAANQTLLGSAIKSLIGTGASAAITVNELLGKQLTFDPIPIRLCVGQYIDVEPLVITDLNISFSKEQYLSDVMQNGVPLHLPIFCTAEIGLSFWVNPSPNLQFMKLLGTEIFGPDPEVASTASIKESLSQSVLPSN